MKKQIICISGWGQKFDSLEFIFNDPIFDPFFVTSLEYSSFDNVENFFADVKSQNFTDPEILIGWSLGGQLALRLIEKKILKPKLLILIAPPFQMIKDARIQAGMSLPVFAEFRKNFADAPSEALKKFSILTAMNDRSANEIARSLDVNDKNFKQLIYWLDELKRFSCFDLDFSNTPRTLYFHGFGDMIVHVSQADYFQENIKNFHKEIFVNCGHAPQLSDVAKMRNAIAKFCDL